MTGRVTDDVEGLSLVRPLMGLRQTAGRDRRIRFTETGFTTESLMEGHYDEKELMSEAAAYFELEPLTGWVQLCAERIPGLLAGKQVAAMMDRTLLAAVPEWDGAGVTYYLTGRNLSAPVRIASRPNPEVSPEGAVLWDALHVRFHEELLAAARRPAT